MKNVSSQAKAMLALMFSFMPMMVSASCGATDYSGGAQSLITMCEYVFVMMEYMIGILYSIASLLTLYSSVGIYIKLNTGEGGFTKSVIILVGSVLFLISVTIVLPAFFGFQMNDGGGKWLKWF